jgi:hypothetical protein
VVVEDNIEIDRTSDEYIKSNLNRIAALQEESSKQMKGNEELNTLISGMILCIYIYLSIRICTYIYTYVLT